jgi:hypothetical protein
MKLRSLVVASATVGALAVAPAAQAADQVVSGTTLGNSVSVTIPGVASFGTNLGASGSTSATALLPVVAIGGWSVSVKDKNSSGTAGHLVRDSSCTTGSNSLTNAIKVYPTASLGNFTPAYSVGTPWTLTSTAETLGAGTGSNNVTVNWVQQSSTSDQLTAGCLYTMTADVTVTGS